MKILTQNGQAMIGKALPYMDVPAQKCQMDDDVKKIIFACNKSTGVQIPILAGCTLLSYYHCCQAINKKRKGYVAPTFLDWFNHYDSQIHFATLDYRTELFQTLESVTGIRCDNTHVINVITEQNREQIKAEIFEKIKSGLPVTVGIDYEQETEEIEGHSVMINGIAPNGDLIVVDSSVPNPEWTAGGDEPKYIVSEYQKSYYNLLKANGHDGYNAVSVVD